MHSDAQEPEEVACTSCSARLQPFQDLPRTHSIYGSASTRGLDRSHSQSCLWRYVPLLPDFPVDWAASNGEQFEHGHCWTPNPQFRNISKPCIAQPIASCPKALELDHFTFRSVWFCGTKVVQADIHRIGLAGTLVIRPRQAPWHWQRDAGSTSEYEKSSHNVAYCDTWWSWLSFCSMSECRLLNQLTTGTRLFYPWPIFINHN